MSDRNPEVENGVAVLPDVKRGTYKVVVEPIATELGLRGGPYSDVVG